MMEVLHGEYDPASNKLLDDPVMRDSSGRRKGEPYPENLGGLSMTYTYRKLEVMIQNDS